MQKIDVNQWFIVFNNVNSLIKITLFLLIWAIIWIPIAIPLARLTKWHPATPITIKQKLSLLTSLYLIVPLLVWWTSKIEGVSLFQYGITWQVNLLQSILFGFVLAVFSVLLTYFLESVLGWLQWQKDQLSKVIDIFLPLLILALFISFIEEIVFRGIFFNFLMQDFSLAIAAIISSAVFALLHLVWERKNALSQLPGLFIMGIVLVIARLINHGSLGLAIGLHCGWVFILSCLDTAGLYSYIKNDKRFLTGEKGKPLASLAGIFVLLLCGVILSFLGKYL